MTMEDTVTKKRQKLRGKADDIESAPESSSHQQTRGNRPEAERQCSTQSLKNKENMVEEIPQSLTPQNNDDADGRAASGSRRSRTNLAASGTTGDKTEKLSENEGQTITNDPITAVKESESSPAKLSTTGEKASDNPSHGTSSGQRKSLGDSMTRRLELCPIEARLSSSLIVGADLDASLAGIEVLPAGMGTVRPDPTDPTIYTSESGFFSKVFDPENEEQQQKVRARAPLQYRGYPAERTPICHA